MRRFYLTCILAAAFFGIVALVQAQDTTYVGKYYDVVKLDRRTQADSLTILEHFVPPSYSTLPTCNSDTEPAIGFDESDNLWKGCSDQSGSFEWNPLGDDYDQDGVRNDFDGNPNTAFTFTADTPFELQVTTTYSGTDARLNFNGTDAYLFSNQSASYRRCAALVLCKENDNAEVVSFTSASVTGLYDITSTGRACNSRDSLTDYLLGASGYLDGNANANATNTAVNGVTCVGTRGT